MKSVHTKLKRLVSLLVILGIFLGTVPVHANQTIEFEPVDLPITELSNARIYVHPENDQIVFLTITGQGIFWTKNGAESWERYPIPGFDTTDVVAMAIAESEPSVRYVITKTEMIRTSNAGSIWEKVLDVNELNGELFKNIAIHPKNHNLVTVFNLNTLYFTYDSWQTFNHKTFIVPITRLIYPEVGFDVLDQKTLYVPNSEEGYAYTNDSGKNWTNIQNPWHPEPNLRPSFVLPDPTNSNILYMGSGANGKLWKSVDKGTTWELVQEENGKNYIMGHPIFDHQSPKPGLHGAQWGFYAYLAPDENTLKVNNTAPWVAGGRVNLAISHQNHRKMYKLGQDGVFKSEDLGQTWTIQNEGLQGFYVQSLHINNEGEFLFVTGNQRLYKTTRDWGEPQHLNWPANRDTWDSRKVYLDPRYPNRQYYYPTVANDPSNHALYYSDDDWETSTAITVLSSGLYYPQGMAFDAADDGPTYIIMQRRELHVRKEHLGIYMSGAPGEDWTWLNLNAGYPYRTLRMTADKTQANMLYVVIGNQEGDQLATLRVNTYTGQFVKIGGEGSVFQTKKVAHITPDPLKPGRIYIGVFPTLDWDQTQSDQIVNYRSDDHGETWTPIRLPGWMFISPQNSDLLIGLHNLRNNGIVYNNDYFKSIDGGHSYQTFHAAYPVYPQESFVRSTNHVFDPNDDNVLYFGTVATGIWKMTFHGQASIFTNSYFPVITTKE